MLLQLLIKTLKRKNIQPPSGQCVGMLQAVQSKCNGSGIKKRSTQSILLKDEVREVFREPHGESYVINCKHMKESWK